jgi:hypothetical protein
MDVYIYICNCMYMFMYMYIDTHAGPLNFLRGRVSRNLGLAHGDGSVNVMTLDFTGECVSCFVINVYPLVI